MTTLGETGTITPQGPDSTLRRQFDNLHRHNLRVLRAAGVSLALGSDSYRDNSVKEEAYLSGLGIFTPLEMVRLWAEATPKAIFPQRKVGCLTDNCEASFLVLGGNPATAFRFVRDIRRRFKDGAELRLP